MLDFLVAHYDWLVAGVAGHLSLSSLSGVFSWVKTKVSQVEAVAKAVEAKAAADVAAAQKLAEPTVVAPVTISK